MRYFDKSHDGYHARRLLRAMLSEASRELQVLGISLPVDDPSYQEHDELARFVLELAELVAFKQDGWAKEQYEL